MAYNGDTNAALLGSPTDISASSLSSEDQTVGFDARES
jgi:hypothetical protein